MGTWRNGPLERKSRKFADKKLDAGVGFDDPSGYEPENSGASLDKLQPGLETEKKLERLRGLWAGTCPASW